MINPDTAEMRSHLESLDRTDSLKIAGKRGRLAVQFYQISKGNEKRPLDQEPKSRRFAE